ncbi:MAG: PilX N-terminal domain-containing pilus assembly protein, partial [Pseudomonadota bacterium]
MKNLSIKPCYSLPNRQRGAVLVISLIILLVITTLAVGSMQNTMLEEKMAGNISDRNLAFQSTESAIREAETFVENIVSLGQFTGANGLHGRTDIEPYIFDQSVWTTSGAHVVAQTDFGSYDSPRYIIKHFTTVTGTTGALNMSGYGDNKGTGDVTIFRITARGTGASADSAEVLLRTQYGSHLEDATV